jgi:hypothetical protein
VNRARSARPGTVLGDQFEAWENVPPRELVHNLVADCPIVIPPRINSKIAAFIIFYLTSPSLPHSWNGGKIARITPTSIYSWRFQSVNGMKSMVEMPGNE